MHLNPASRCSQPLIFGQVFKSPSLVAGIQTPIAFLIALHISLMLPRYHTYRHQFSYTIATTGMLAFAKLGLSRTEPEGLRIKDRILSCQLPYFGRAVSPHAVHGLIKLKHETVLYTRHPTTREFPRFVTLFRYLRSCSSPYICWQTHMIL